ncbi:MAG: hypothetical protein LC798_08915, partial [Chloroflexi bacterium]|nr:hypothetical protein [Chloroflexota bacterium]
MRWIAVIALAGCGAPQRAPTTCGHDEPKGSPAQLRATSGTIALPRRCEGTRGYDRGWSIVVRGSGTRALAIRGTPPASICATPPAAGATCTHVDANIVGESIR